MVDLEKLMNSKNSLKIWSHHLSEYESEKKIDNRSFINLRKINLFIGQNNSGKSRLLRKLFNSKPDELFFHTNDATEKFRPSIQPLINLIQPTIDYSYITGHDFHKLFGAGEFLHYSDIEAIFSRYQTLIDNLFNNFTSIGGNSAANNYTALKRNFNATTRKKSDYDKKSLVDSIIPSSQYYIPILRGMRPLGGNSSDHYKERTKTDYFPSLPPSKHVVTGLHFYELLTEFLLGQPEQRDLIREYESLLTAEFFEGKTVTLIPEHKKDTVSIKIGAENQYPIYNLGDGLQQVIIITSAAFLEKEPALFFIEEPENGLHPGLLKRLERFLETHTQHRYLISTHSNHLLELSDLNENISVHQVRKISTGNIATFKTNELTNNKEILADLGVSPSSVYLANCSIWVEGITDRLYLKAYLSKYISDLPEGQERERYTRYNENYHYVFVEYQGGTLGHWNFTENEISELDENLNAVKTCSEAFLVADGDITNKGNRAKILEEQLNDRIFILSCKEIENLIPDDVLKSVATSVFSSMRKDKENLDAKAILTLNYSDYCSSMNGIGYHLDQKLGLPGKGRENRRIFSDESGTIYDKVRFCYAITGHMKSNEWKLTEEISGLCKAILAHIEKNNPL